MQKIMKSWAPKLLAVALVVTAIGIQSQTAFAASVTSFSDNLSRLKASTAANHEIFFVSPSGIAAAGTVTLTFASGFNLSTIVFGDIDFATGSTGVCTSATYTEQTLAAAPSGATWGVAVSGQVLTLTSGSGTSTAGNCVRFRIGTNTTTGGTGTHQITNPTAGSYTVTIAGSFGDSGVAAVVIISNDQVTIDATVDPSITFSISANAIHFGTLTASNARFADTSTGQTTTTTAHTLAAGTNATSGYVMYVSGDTLKSGANSVTAIGGSATASSPGTSQFGFNLADTAPSGGTGTATAPYATSTSYAFNATPSTQVQVAGATGATASTTYSASYIANIPSNQQAGSYTTTLTYTATATY